MSNPLLQINPGTTYAQRKAELDTARFIDVRNLAHLEYEKDDRTKLMSYNQTLEDRDKVKQTILDFELAKGFITGGAEPQPQGAPQMNMPFPPQPQFQQPPNGAPNGQPAPQYQQPQFQQPPPPQAFAPQQPPQQQFAPPPQQQMAPPPQQMMAPPPVATPAQVAQVAQQAPVQMQEAPQATGRKRRTGTNVAPPPAAPAPQAPPPVAGPGAFMAPPGMPPQQFAPPQASFAPQAAPGFAPQPAPGFAPVGFAPAATPVPQSAPPPPTVHPTAGVDLTPLLAKIDSLGQVVNQLIDLAGAQKAQIEQLAAQVAESKRIGLEVLTTSHHQYIVNPQLGSSIADKKTLPEFRQHLSQFVGP